MLFPAPPFGLDTAITGIRPQATFNAAILRYCNYIALSLQYRIVATISQQYCCDIVYRRTSP